METEPRAKLNPRIEPVILLDDVNVNQENVDAVSENGQTNQTSGPVDGNTKNENLKRTVAFLIAEKSKEREKHAAMMRKNDVLFENEQAKLERKIVQLEEANNRNEKRLQKELQNRDFHFQQQCGQLRSTIQDAYQKERNALIEQISDLVKEKNEIQNEYEQEKKALIEQINTLDKLVEEEKAEKEKRIQKLVVSYEAHIVKFEEVVRERDSLKNELANQVELSGKAVYVLQEENRKLQQNQGTITTDWTAENKENQPSSSFDEAMQDCIAKLTKQNQDVERHT